MRASFFHNLQSVSFTAKQDYAADELLKVAHCNLLDIITKYNFVATGFHEAGEFFF